jgi:hypothetical protein
VEWIQTAQDWDQWWILVNTVMNLGYLSDYKLLKNDKAPSSGSHSWSGSGRKEKFFPYLCPESNPVVQPEAWSPH